MLARMQESLPARSPQPSLGLLQTSTLNYYGTPADDQKKLIDWLDPKHQRAKHSSVHNIVRKSYMEGTGRWFLDSQTLKGWENEGGSPIWIHGLVGCGKTVLCSSIIENIKESCAHLPTQLCFFYCSSLDSERQDLDAILRLILVTLCTVDTAPLQVQELYRECQNTYPIEVPSTERLKKTCLAMLKDGTDDGTSLLPKEKDGTNSKKRIYLVIDALDEVPLQHSHDVLTFLQELATASLPHLNLLITSRYDSRIEVTLGGASFWRIIPIMKESVKEDIELYVNKFVHDDTRLSKLCKKSITLKELMHEKFVEKGNGMFKWAALQLSMLKRLRVLNFFTAEQELRRLPDDLNATYARILSQLDDVLVDHAMVALQWLTTSARSLFVDELVEACAIKVGRIPLLDDPQNRLDEDDILEMLHDLVIVENLSGSTTVPRQRRKVILAHFSVHEFLIDREILIGSSKRLTITSKQSHQFLAKSCLSYLYYTRAQQRLDCPLREYAWYNWEHHISPRSDAKKQRIRRKAAKLYQLLVTRVPKLLDISHTLSSVNTPTSPEQDLALAVDWLPGDQLESLRVLQQTLAVMGGHPKTIIHNRRDSLSYHLFTPLGESRGDIRLISLTPCLDDCRDIEGDLYLVSLEDKPVYDALSYVWGDSSESEYILVNGTHYEVRGNLGGLLRRLRLRPEDESQFLWVDAICINQENREEKLHQIQRMPQIFRQAKEVVIGLGKEQPNDEKAINYMTLIAQGLREGEIGNSGGKSSISTLLNRIESDASGWSSIMELFNRQWWRKAWVTQEIVLAADATLLYGTMSLKFTVVEQLMRCLKALEILLEQTTGKTTSFQRLRDDWGWQAAFQICLTRHEYQSNHPIGLPQLLWRFKEKDCTYPADKIYSVLSMVTQPGDAIECDYSKPALKNFAEITINIISRYHCLDIFSICTFYRSYGRRNEQPSWVPDFTSQLPLGPPSSLVVPLSLGVFAGRASMSLFSAGGPGSSPKFTTSNARDTFTTIGRATDKILMCTRHSESVVDGVSLQRLLRINSLRTVLTTILGMESQSLWTAPNDERTVMEAFWKTILAEQWNEGELLSDSRLPAQLRIPPRTQSEYLALCKFETLSQHLRFIRGRQFILTQNGRLGLVPSWAMRDDTIVVMPGGAVPYVLRTVGQEWELIGECYVEGIMHGEAMKDEAEMDNFILI